MEHAKLIEEIETYCRAAGISPSTLCVRSIGNSRFINRMQSKVEQFDQQAAKIRAFMAENPPAGAANEAVDRLSSDRVA